MQAVSKKVLLYRQEASFTKTACNSIELFLRIGDILTLSLLGTLHVN